MFVHFGEYVQRTRRDMVDASSQAQCPEAVVFVDDASLMQSNILWKFDWMTASVYCNRIRHNVFLASIHPASRGGTAHTASLFWIVTREPEFRRGICACKE